MRKNPRITPKDRNAIKGAIRRAFSRSELHRRILNNSIVRGFLDASRPRVKTWCKCSICGKLDAKSYMDIDHINPVVPVNTSFEDMSLDEFVNNVWCEEKYLQSICHTCHDSKTKLEREQRKKHRKAKNGKK